ncbi:N-acetyl-gamma-glutamyl-phosphate reductase [Rubellimicrobium thermophilum DSM 16684]|uniref:N-acetyl-gamma-glutamyl-phosphate reductase n=1 Tax=Rubellimicrobium thermophilum DSM 16684 TaxID=1123069 RepID=S9R314_9RHOB|nr:N-acetyl-gamma-glutamyl-phosphate reductase [Rubellimicrobium thermophilum DSM 16684]
MTLQQTSSPSDAPARMARVAVVGASGVYGGRAAAPRSPADGGMEVVALTADRKAGQSIAQVFPHLRHLDLPRLTAVEAVDWSGIDLAFLALPHGLSQALVAKLPRNLRIVDLGADFRLDPASYERWYGQPHAAPDLQQEAVYGLTEFYRDRIRKARLVAGTGCNAACVQFALRPLIAEGLIDLDDIICDLKNGVSGAGRGLKETMLFAERSEDVQGYSQGGRHRHLGEFDREFSALAGARGAHPVHAPISSPSIAASWLPAMSRAIRRRSMPRCAISMRPNPSSSCFPTGNCRRWPMSRARTSSMSA